MAAPTPLISARYLNVIVGGAALVLFAWLALRHVGESVFLEDQVDQLQNFESLLRLEPEGLWGGIMSDTCPPARALGPAGAIVFGVPVALGLGIDSIHFITSLLIAIGTATVAIVCIPVVLIVAAVTGRDAEAAGQPRDTHRSRDRCGCCCAPVCRIGEHDRPSKHTRHSVACRSDGTR